MSHDRPPAEPRAARGPARRSILAPLMLGAAAAPGAAALAQEAVPLEPIEISAASRTGLSPASVGSAVTVVEREEIERRQARTAAEVLQDIPGVEIGQTRPGAWTPVSIRGSDSDQVLVLIDGMELGDPSATSTSYQFDHLTSLDIERIEVLRGNQSSLYGSDAIGGVINIVTRRAPRDGVMATGEVEVGPHGLVDGGASLFWGGESADLRLTAFGRRFDGPSIVDPRTATGPSDEDDAYEAKGLSGRGSWRPTRDIEVSLGGFYSVTKLEYDDTTADGFDEVDKDEYALGGRVTWDMPGGWLTHEASASIYNARREYHTGYSRPGGDIYDGSKSNIGYTATLRPLHWATLVGGVDFETEWTDQITAYTGNFEEDISTNSVFGELALEPLDGLTVTGAARLDDNSRFGTFATWRTTAAYFTALSDEVEAKLRASYGTGAKAPGLYQLYDPTYGNRTLEVEESKGWDVGLDLYAFDRMMSLEATYFRNDVTDEIAFGTRDDGSSGYLQYGETEQQGVEFGASLRPLDWLSLRQSWTWLLARDGASGDWRGRARHSGSTSITVLPVEDVSVTALARYSSGDSSSSSGHAPGFAVFDLTASWQVQENVQVFGRIENVFDAEYQESYGRRTPGLGAYAGLRFAFGGR